MKVDTTPLYALVLQAREVLAAFRSETDGPRRTELLEAYNAIQAAYCESLRENLRLHQASHLPFGGVRFPMRRPGSGSPRP